MSASGAATAIGRTESVAVQRRAPLPVRKAGSYLLLTIVSVLVAFPLLLALSYSFMSEFDIATFPPPVIPAHPSLDNYGKVLATIPIGRYLFNSFIVSTAVVIGHVFTSSLSSFAFSCLIISDELMRTTQVGIAQLRFEESLRWGLVMAGVIMVAVPTLALLVLGQRQLIRGLTAGAVKG